MQKLPNAVKKEAPPDQLDFPLPAGNQGTDCVDRQRILPYRGGPIVSLFNASILSCSSFRMSIIRVSLLLV